MEIIKPLTDTDFDTVYAAHAAAFKNYDRTWTRDELEKMLYRRAYVPSLSFGAFDGDRLVSFTLNGIGSYGGLQTVYDASTGTIGEYQRKGLAGRIFNESLPYLRQAGMQQYLLEVLQHNKSAVSVYTNTGFHVARELNYFVAPNDAVQAGGKTPPAGIHLQQTKITPAQMTSFLDFNPSWQNTFEAIARKPEDFIVAGAFDGEKLIGYGIIEPSSGDVPQLAVDRPYRRAGIATTLLQELLKFNEAAIVRVLNTDPACTHITAFLAANGMPVTGKQFEMIKSLG